MPTLAAISATFLSLSSRARICLFLSHSKKNSFILLLLHILVKVQLVKLDFFTMMAMVEFPLLFTVHLTCTSVWSIASIFIVSATAKEVSVESSETFLDPPLDW